LAGAWQARVEAPLAKAEPGPNDLPSLIFNGMVQAFTALPVRGVIWYQGETNAAQAARYAEAFPRLIRDWRAHWAAASGTAALPFYFVQLSSFGPRPNLTGGSPWAELREAQQRTLALPATGMAVSIDVGDAQDIHPRDKRPVGERLARIALAHTYHRAVPFSGPRLLGSRALPGGRFELRFDSPLQTRDGAAPRGFTVAGADQRFVPAQVSLAGRRAVVAHPGVPVPTAVRYAWADTPLDANLVGANGLPAAPLRTDRFPLVTRNAKPEF
jgi:sialate O-acetylesterase